MATEPLTKDDFEITFALTQVDLDAWAELGGANGRIHVDPEWARDRYGNTVVAGLQVVANVVERAAASLAEQGRPSNVANVTSKFVNLNHPGERIRAKLHVASETSDEIQIDFTTSTPRYEPTVVGSVTLRH